MYVHIERAHLVGMELRLWDNSRINLSQNKPNPRSLSIKFEFLNFLKSKLKKLYFREKRVQSFRKKIFLKKGFLCTFLVENEKFRPIST